MQTRHNKNERQPVLQPRVSSHQYESLKAQLKLLTPSQLRRLQGEINDSLVPENPSLLTGEELDMISSLF